MKTAGAILSEARKKKGLSIKQISDRTKIDCRYIKAIEANDYENLPPSTFIKGFVRNIALALDKNPEEAVAVFRRDFKEKKEDKKKKFRFKKSIWSKKLLMFLGAVLFFAAYILFQYRMVLRPPKLKVEIPKNKAVLVSPVKVEGISEVGVNIIIEGRTIRPDINGYFSTQLELPLGENKIAIEAISRFGKSSRREIELTVISND